MTIFHLVFQFISQSIYRVPVNKFMGSCCVDLLDVRCSGYEEQVLMY